MRRLVRKWAWLFLLLPMSASAQDHGLWAYGCDHFLYGACFRVPNDMKVTQSVPADFSLHSFMRGERSVLTVYEGNAPRRPSSAATQSLELKADGYRLRGFVEHQGAQTRYSVYMESARAGDMSLHLFGEVNDPTDRSILAAVLGGFRVCRFKQTRSDQILSCPRRSDWGQQLAAWVVGGSSEGGSAGAPATSTFN